MNDALRQAPQAAVERPFWPYNERVPNTANAHLAAALTGRASRSQVAASQLISRGSSAGARGQGPRNTAEKSLDTLRVVLQKYINQELDAVLQKFVKLYMDPAIHNLRNSSSQEVASDELLRVVLCRILDEAKKMYEPSTPPPASIPAITFSSSPYSNVSEAESIHEPFARYGQRRDSDGDSYSSAGSSAKRMKTEKPKKASSAPRRAQESSKPLNSTVDMSVPAGTKFMLGSSANRVLGYENARGRIYSKHPDLFKTEAQCWCFSPEDFETGTLGLRTDVAQYTVVVRSFSPDSSLMVHGEFVKFSDEFYASWLRSRPGLPDLMYVGDQEDKQWLFENKIMTAAGGKAFLVFAEDIREILRTEPSATPPRKGVVSGAKEFTIPAFMLDKVRAAAQRHTASGSGRSRSGSSASSPFSQNSHSPAPTEPDQDDDRGPSVTPPPNPQHEGAYSNQQVNHRNPYGQNSPEGFFSPLMDDNDVFTGDNDVFAPQDTDFSAGSSLDAIHPSIGNFQGHDLGQLGPLDF